MLTALTAAVGKDCGGKAGVLGTLMRSGFPVPDGFVVPFDRGSRRAGSEEALREDVESELARLGDPVVAVRSSGQSEDTEQASAAGQYESVIGVRGVDEVCEAIVACLKSAHSGRVDSYFSRLRSVVPEASRIAALVQPVIEADISGVMFTPPDAEGPTRIEASWGLGLAVVGGTATPDTYEMSFTGGIRCAPGSKRTRFDLDTERGGVVSSSVAVNEQSARTLDDATVLALAELGHGISQLLAAPQDVEWAIANGVVWILQSRPITADLPAFDAAASSDSQTQLHGIPASDGTVTAPARIVRGPSDFSAVRHGDIVVCPFTDPAWTPLFGVAAGFITEVGGALSHAAIVAREYGIPSVLGVADATTRIDNDARITVNGAAGTVSIAGTGAPTVEPSEADRGTGTPNP